MGTNYGDWRNLADDHSKSRFTAMPYRTLDEWKLRREKLRRQILVSAGLWPPPTRPPIVYQRFDRFHGDGFTVDKVLIQTLSGLYLAGNLYLPKNTTRKVPAVLVPHGHWKNGRVHQAEDYSVPALCINLAKQGYAAFAYDMVGYNDTRQLKHDFGESVEEQLWQFGPMGVQLWNSIRALDFLEVTPEVDARRVAVTGASGGGTQTILLAAVDDRVRAAAPVDMVSAHFQGDDACEMAPGLRVATNNVEIAAMMAPRRMLMVSSTKDWTKDTPLKEFKMVQGIYALYGRPERVGNAHIDARHNYNRESREAVYEFLHRALGGPRLSKRDLTERVQETMKPSDLLFGDSSPCASCKVKTEKQLFDLWKNYARNQTRGMAVPQLRELMQATVGAEWPDRVAAIPAGESVLLERETSGERVPARWIAGREKSVAVVVHEYGSAKAMESGMANDHEKKRWSILYLDVFQTGAAEVERPAKRKDHLTFHRSDDAYRVQDILTALAFASSAAPAAVDLVCEGRARLWCLTAAALSPEPVTLVAETETLDSDSTKSLMIPGLERAGGLAALLRLATESRSKVPMPSQ